MSRFFQTGPPGLLELIFQSPVAISGIVTITLTAFLRWLLPSGGERLAERDRRRQLDWDQRKEYYDDLQHRVTELEREVHHWQAEVHKWRDYHRECLERNDRLTTQYNDLILEVAKLRAVVNGKAQPDRPEA